MKSLENRVKAQYIYISIAAVALAILFWCWCYTSQSELALNIVSSNVKTYAISLLIFVAFLIICSYLNFKRCERTPQIIEAKKLSRNTQIIVCTVMPVIGLLFFLEWGLHSQHLEVGEENAAYSYFPLKIRGLLTVLFLLWIGIYVIKKYDIDKITLYGIYFLALLVSFLGVYVVNPYAPWGSLNNTVTITETIYNVFDMVPFTWKTTPLYGHFGLLFLIPTKIFGASVVTIGVCLAIGELIEEAALLYVIDSFESKNWIKGLIALAAIVRPTYRYPAITPIRTMWPVLICGMLVFIHKKNKADKAGWIVLSYILAGCAILQNTETGIGCLLGVSAYYLWKAIYHYKSENKNSKFLVSQIFKHLVLFIAGFLLPIILVNIYNFCCGMREPVFRSFFYPFIGDDWTTNELRWNVPIGNHAWIYIIILLMGCLAFAIVELFFLKTEVRYAPIMGISVIGIVVFCYYFNEAHWGCMDIVRKICAMLTIFVISEFYTCLENKNADILSQVKRSTVILALIIFGNLAISCVLSDPIRISQMYKAGLYNGEAVIEEAENVLIDNVPENIYGVGQGISTIYHELGWDNYARYRDTSALYINDVENAYEELVQQILAHDSFLIGDSGCDTGIQARVLEYDDSYQLKSSFTFLDYPYAYYSRY